MYFDKFDNNKKIDSLYREIAKLGSTQKPIEKIQEKFKELKYYQEIEAKEIRKRFEDSLHLPLDCSDEILNEAQRLVNKFKCHLNF